MEKIQYLCNRINNVEWSGILLYSIKGSIRNPETMELHAEDIIPMDKGTAATTEYEYNKKSMFNTEEFDDKHIDYISDTCEKNPEVLDWKIGHIHSHNHMGVFFSGTDVKELEDNAKSHNFYLSLVVNNKMETVAKVITYAESENTFNASFKAKDENGEDYEVKKEKLSFKKATTKTYDCEVNKADQEIRVDSRFVSYVDAIIEEADKRARPVYGTYKGYSGGINPQNKNYWDDGDDYWNDWGGRSYQQKSFQASQSGVELPLYTQTKVTTENRNRSKSNFEQLTTSSTNNIQNRVNKFVEENDLGSLSISVSPIEQFTVYLLNNGEMEENITVEEFLELIEDEIIRGTWSFDAKDFVLKYPDYYMQFFPEEAEDEGYFIEVLKAVIEVFDEVEIMYDFIQPLNKALKALAVNFVKTNKL